MPPKPSITPTRPVMEALDELSTLAASLAADAAGSRLLLGITGSPGSGKTTLAKALVEHLNRARHGIAAYLPMDGFHLANANLDDLGRHDRKGAIDTFDGWGFVALLERLRLETGHAIYAPSFKRSIDEGIAGDITIPADASIIVVEGNYLLVDQEPWNKVKDILDASWFCTTPADEREARLIDRHVRHGRSIEAAIKWARVVDGANANLIETTIDRADLVVSGETGRILRNP